MRSALGRLAREEAGMTMGLVIMMIVVLGVMGAGLLVFAQRNLEGVVESNRGQQAAELADAGLEAARRQLSSVDARPTSYDANEDNGDSEWSEVGCPSPLPGGPDLPDGCGKRLSFEDGEIYVVIRFLEPSTTVEQPYQPDRAPEVLPEGAADANGDGYPDYPRSRSYFRVTVRANDGSAMRAYQAIYRTQNFEFPVAYFATRDIDFNGNATEVHGVSLFARRNVYELRAERITGTDSAYGDWATNPDGSPNAYNRTPRATDAAGVAALGTVTYAPTADDGAQKANKACPQRYGYRDYDSASDQLPARPSPDKCSEPPPTASFPRPEFAPNTWGDPAGQPEDKITFPFPASDEAADAEVIDSLRQKAMDQGRYLRVDNGTSATQIEIDNSTGPKTPQQAVYPKESDLDTVVFVEFTGSAKGSVVYKAETSNDDNQGKCTIVVVNGDLETSNDADDFEGVLIVRDGVTPGQATEEAAIPVFTNAGNFAIEGFVNVEGDMSLAGNVGGNLGNLVNGIPGLLTVDLWSWRECYEAGCGL